MRREAVEPSGTFASIVPLPDCHLFGECRRPYDPRLRIGRGYLVRVRGGHEDD